MNIRESLTPISKRIVAVLRALRDTPADMEPEFTAMYGQTKDYTMTSVERMYALHKAVKYVVDAGIPGDFVECGVWRGGSTMLMAKTLKKQKDVKRKIYLYDTFEGMPEPTKFDREQATKSSAASVWKKHQRKTHNEWCYSPLDEVKRNMRSTGYPQNKIVFVKGKVERTIPKTMPERIAILRLDTDWYESTYHELVHLFPRVSPGGVIIIDDYGHWEGARKAVDQYLKEQNIHLLLYRIDYTGRIAIKR